MKRGAEERGEEFEALREIIGNFEVSMSSRSRAAARLVGAVPQEGEAAHRGREPAARRGAVLQPPKDIHPLSCAHIQAVDVKIL